MASQSSNESEDLTVAQVYVHSLKESLIGPVIEYVGKSGDTTEFQRFLNPKLKLFIEELVAEFSEHSKEKKKLIKTKEDNLTLKKRITEISKTDEDLKNEVKELRKQLDEKNNEIEDIKITTAIKLRESYKEKWEECADLQNKSMKEMDDLITECRTKFENLRLSHNTVQSKTALQKLLDIFKPKKPKARKTISTPLQTPSSRRPNASAAKSPEIEVDQNWAPTVQIQSLTQEMADIWNISKSSRKSTPSATVSKNPENDDRDVHQ